MLSFKALSEKKTKVKINPKMKDVMEDGMPITMHAYSKGGKVKKKKDIAEGGCESLPGMAKGGKLEVKKNHGDDCDCQKCEKKRRKEDVNDGPDVQSEATYPSDFKKGSPVATKKKGRPNAQGPESGKKEIDEAKVDKGRSDYGKASIRNYRRMGPGHDDPGMFDPEGKRGKTIEKRREEHKARRGVKGAKVPAYKRESFEKFVECWKTHKKQGMKMKGGKLVPNCVPKNEETYIKNNSQTIYGNQEEVSEKSDQSIQTKTETSLVRFSELSEVTRLKKEKGYVKGGTKKPTGTKQKDSALDFVKAQLTKQYGKGAIMSGGSKQQKKVKGAKSTVGTGKYKKAADQKKQTAADAKKRGFKSVQNYTDTMARYGGKDNYDKGRGLGT